jgi:hypothetical protein
MDWLRLEGEELESIGRVAVAALRIIGEQALAKMSAYDVVVTVALGSGIWGWFMQEQEKQERHRPGQLNNRHRRAEKRNGCRGKAAIPVPWRHRLPRRQKMAQTQIRVRAVVLTGTFGLSMPNPNVVRIHLFDWTPQPRCSLNHGGGRTPRRQRPGKPATR